MDEKQNAMMSFSLRSWIPLLSIIFQNDKGIQKCFRLIMMHRKTGEKNPEDYVKRGKLPKTACGCYAMRNDI